MACEADHAMRMYSCTMLQTVLVLQVDATVKALKLCPMLCDTDAYTTQI